ncbi:ATP-binding protein [Streptomyces sp. NPDC004561]
MHWWEGAGRRAGHQVVQSGRARGPGGRLVVWLRLVQQVRRLPPRPQSAAVARRFLGNVLDGVASDVVDTAQLLVSELVTNAVMHAHTEVEVRA